MRAGWSDVTGVQLDWMDARGCPAVRLTRRKNAWVVAACGFVPPPSGNLPTSWDDARKQPEWSLPSDFQAPLAALTVVSPEQIVRQTSPDALLADLVSTTAEASEPTAAKKKLGVRRAETTAPAKQAASSDALPAEVKSGVPVSANGLRFVTMPLAEEPFVIQSGLPEYQTLWLSRLLPEGRRPTAGSIQTVPSSLLSSLSEQPEFVAAGGTALAMFVLRETVYLAGYREGSLLLFRQCPGVSGWEALRKSVKLRLGLDEELVDEILDDTLVDPRETMEPFVRPVLQQMEMSLDYMLNRHHLNVDRIFLMGLPSGARYWNQMSEELTGRTLLAPSVFAGLEFGAKARKAQSELNDSKSQVFLGAFGAARAAMEVSA